MTPRQGSRAELKRDTARELGTDQGPGQRETTEKSNCNFCDEYQRLESHV